MEKEYISLAMMKNHLNVDASFTDDDIYIRELIGVANNVVAEELCVDLVDLETPEGALPAGVRQAIMLLVGNYYSNREPVAFGTTVTKIPLSFNHLIGLYRNYKG